MKMFSVAVMSAAVLTGLAGAGVAYEIASTGDSGTATSTTPTTPTEAAAKPGKRFAPCEPPAVREGKACVTDVVRTVVLPAASARVGAVAGRAGSGNDGPLHDAFDDHGDDGPLHDAFDDHGDDFDDHDAFDDHGGDRDDDHDDDDHDDDRDDDHDDDSDDDD